MRDFFIEFVLPTLLAVAFCAVIIAGGIYGTAKYVCSSWHAATGDETRVIAGTCMVRHNGRYVTLDSWTDEHQIRVRGGEK